MSDYFKGVLIGLGLIFGGFYFFKWLIRAQRKHDAEYKDNSYKCNSCQWTGTKIRFGKCPHCTSDNISIY